MNHRKQYSSGGAGSGDENGHRREHLRNNMSADGVMMNNTQFRSANNISTSNRPVATAPHPHPHPNDDNGEDNDYSKSGNKKQSAADLQRRRPTTSVGTTTADTTMDHRSTSSSQRSPPQQLDADTIATIRRELLDSIMKEYVLIPRSYLRQIQEQLQRSDPTGAAATLTDAAVVAIQEQLSGVSAAEVALSPVTPTATTPALSTATIPEVSGAAVPTIQERLQTRRIGNTRDDEHEQSPALRSSVKDPVSLSDNNNNNSDTILGGRERTDSINPSRSGKKRKAADGTGLEPNTAPPERLWKLFPRLTAKAVELLGRHRDNTLSEIEWTEEMYVLQVLGESKIKTMPLHHQRTVR